MASRKSQPATNGQSGSITGYGVDDPIYSKLSGHGVAAHDAMMNVRIELDEFVNALFPYQGFSEPSFTIHYPENTQIQAFLDAYLTLDREGSWDVKRLARNLYSYNSSMSLDKFLEQIAQRLLVDGVAYCSIEWGKIDATQLDLVVPTHFGYLPASTIREKTDKYGNRSYIQKYNPLVAPNQVKELKGKTTQLDSNNVFAVRYRYGDPPVRVSRKNSVKHHSLRRQLVDRFGANAHPEEITFEAERLRYTEQSKIQRHEELEKAKVRKIFGLPVNSWLYSTKNSDADVTDYYRAYRLVEHLTYIIYLRTDLISEFNRQVLARIASINSLPSCPELRYIGNVPMPPQLLT